MRMTPTMRHRRKQTRRKYPRMTGAHFRRISTLPHIELRFRDIIDIYELSSVNGTEARV